MKTENETLNPCQEIRNLDWLRDDIIGRRALIDTPFGEKPLLYADYTASGRSLHSVEDTIRAILPWYANTHTEDDYTGRLMSHLLHQAESRIKEHVNAGEAGKVIPVGTGATGAIQRLLTLLGVYLPPTTRRRLDELMHRFCDAIPERHLLPELQSAIEQQRPIVFVGPYEHHSNEIMWRQGLCEVVEIPLDDHGELDLKALDVMMSSQEYQGRTRIGSFSAASNVTGILTDVHEVARIIHAHGGIACFDFAACAPYVDIDMSPGDDGYLDAVVFSPHKFLGGPGSSGVLVFNEKIYQSDLPPSVAGGGTVAYVTSQEEMFLDNIEERELAGTPGILQTVRVALAMDIKNKVGHERIEVIEDYFFGKMMSRFSDDPRIEIYGPEDPARRINIIPFNIRHQDRILHPKFVTRLFSDLFGIQTRAGCSCAGPYGHKVLGISDERSQELIRYLQQCGYYGLKPGWVRLNLHYAFSEEEVDYLLDATEFIIVHGARFLEDYLFDFMTGEWKPVNDLSMPEISLDSLQGCRSRQWTSVRIFAEQLEAAAALASARREPGHFEHFGPDIERFMFFHTLSSTGIGEAA